MGDKNTIKREYETTKTTIKKLSEKYKVSENTIKSWKNRDKKNGAEWIKEGATNKKKSATKKEKVQLKKAVQEITKSDLSEKQKLYCIFRGMGHVILQAGLKAGYSKSTAYTTCYGMEKQDLIKQEIRKFQQIRYEGMIHGEKDIILQYYRIAFADIGDYLEEGEDGEISLKPLDAMDSGIIKEISVEKDMKFSESGMVLENQKIKFKLESKHPALRALGEINNMFKQELKLSGKVEHSNKDLSTEELALKLAELQKKRK